MLMVKAIVRPEKSSEILAELNEAGYPAVTKLDVVGRGKQRGVKVGNVVYDEIPKEMLIFVIEDECKDDVVSIIARKAKTGQAGAFGDGKIFISPVEEAYTISSGLKGL
ncbi:P-II family nitrogen regulator [Desulfuribacillus alkaliarsenatis]|uniref:Nitrogen fixation protein NifHD n=1 Tax=Desulfuribacillus alkaliarsenatis TaxID=766136 RepID=A0A1E5G0C4_9FIRM|nr:P-II family nitrogen regulator [Desulfuribacillus alkaliarsenatis]OEF96272.1 nitrogen fixation protein NifHD [Desulfuribacillus alkaliarsenatis]